MTLEEHGLRFRLNGLLLYDEDGEEVVGMIYEPMWTLKDLSSEDKVELGKRVYAALDSPLRKNLTDPECYYLVLREHGIQCPHNFLVDRICTMCGDLILAINAKENTEGLRLLDEWLQRMSPERRAMYGRIRKLLDEIGPIDFDVTKALRKLRRNA